MADEELPTPEGDKPAWWNPKRIYEFAKHIVQLENAISSLKEENRELRVQVRNLQQQTTKLTGQMEILVDFVKGAMDTKIDYRIDARFDELMRHVYSEKEKSEK